MKNVNKYIVAALMAAITITASAQQVTTMYFLENTPMRHTINPAFQPVSQGYLNFTPLGWSSISLGNNSLTMSDIFLVDRDPNSPTYGKTITILHPNAKAQQANFLKQIRSVTAINGDITLGLLNLGTRIKDNGYLTIGINERIELGNTLPRDLIAYPMGGIDFTGTGSTPFNLMGLGLGGTMYTEISGGYSHKINEKWTVGGKLKFLMGHIYGKFNSKQLTINGSTNAINLNGQLDLDFAGPINTAYLNSYMAGKNAQQVIDGFSDGTFDTNQLLNTANFTSLIVPSGYGAAIDLGFTFKPIEQLQISAAVTDLGFIYWTKGTHYDCNMNSTFNGVGNIDYGDPQYRDAQGNFDISKVSNQATQNLQNILNGITFSTPTNNVGMARMISTRLNVGFDANFWDNRIGLGVVSATRLYNARLYEEVTFGFAFRPVNWFNIAASYSLLNNGKYSNIGAGIGFMPYDGINLTLALDYIPTSYAALPNTQTYVIPDKAKMVNVALGFSICWGSNRRDKDHDGVWDKIDLCPNTPRGVQVDSVGCPLDEDHDGVPDYLDHCLGTPAEARRFVDSTGCMLDTDGDGVEDYKDQCPNTPAEAAGKVDSIGCPLDSDGDGVPDYKDECPDTPQEAWGKVDANGCPIDSDGDGVPDYLDQCPNTPEAARGLVDEKGCPVDSDGDGVPDFMDECPNTPKEVNGKVDPKGCILDSDGDGVPDYKDECPFVIGVPENKGCPEVKREVRQLLNKAMQGIEFETGKASIKSKSYPLLDLIATIFIDNSNYFVEVQGHTDNTGKAEINKELSQKRANAVMEYLIGKGVPAERLSAKGYGDEMPVADNKTKAGRAKNRRVEFKISFEQISYETVLDHADPAPAQTDSTAVAQ